VITWLVLIGAILLLLSDRVRPDLVARLVMGPGGYQFRDYVRVGLPLTVILFIIVILLLPVFWPLTPYTFPPVIHFHSST